MNEFKVSPSVEFESPYIKAKHDILKAKESFRKLTEGEKRQLAEELFGAEMAARLYRMMCRRM